MTKRLICTLFLTAFASQPVMSDVTLVGKIPANSGAGSEVTSTQRLDANNYIEFYEDGTSAHVHVDFAHNIDPYLSKVRPYPTDRDVCQILGSSPVADLYHEKGKILIGCPSHEMGAIGDRQKEGALIVAEIEERESNFELISWTLLRLPN